MFQILRVAAVIVLSSAWSSGQGVPKAQAVPPLRLPKVAEPTDPPPQNFEDRLTGVAFHLSPGWNLTRTDGELSTFRLDARSATARTRLRGVAALAFNPFPSSTFSGALFYFSSIAQSSAEACAAQASAKPSQLLPPARVGDITYARGHDEHGKICTEARNTTYTVFHERSCLRFDLTINTFCGGEVSGARDITENQLQKVQERLENILATVHFVAR